VDRPESDDIDLGALAQRHLWGHFTNLSSVQREGLPIIQRGQGAYVYDQNGKRYLDGLSGLFTVNIGHGREELARAAASQSETLGYFPLWSFGHEPGIRLAAKLCELAPGDLNRVFFTTGGGDALESAWKLAVQYYAAVGQPLRRKVISRYYAYHGTTLGALSITGIPAIRQPFEPLLPWAIKVANTNQYRCGLCSQSTKCTLDCAEEVERAIIAEGPETVAMVVMEPVQNTGGALVPPDGYWKRVREICDKYGVLLVSDEVICGFGRLGYWFGCQRFDYQPDMITFAKGVTSGYAPLGGVIVSDRLAAPFLEDDTAVFLHGLTFGGHPVSCAVALANIEVMEKENILANVLENEPFFDEVMEQLKELPFVGDVRGCGYFRVLELVKDKNTKQSFTDEECNWLLRDELSPRIFEAGLICRVDDRADPVLVLSPTLICGPQELRFIAEVLTDALQHAAEEFQKR
jgi:adenosylmethionine-8-amino-7-oxononanoate aminotransferase